MKVLILEILLVKNWSSSNWKWFFSVNETWMKNVPKALTVYQKFGFFLHQNHNFWERTWKVFCKMSTSCKWWRKYFNITLNGFLFIMVNIFSKHACASGPQLFNLTKKELILMLSTMVVYSETNENIYFMKLQECYALCKPSIL